MFWPPHWIGSLQNMSYIRKLYNNAYSIHTIRHKSTTTHIVFTQQYIVVVL
jgi:hypothetical protein